MDGLQLSTRVRGALGLILPLTARKARILPRTHNFSLYAIPCHYRRRTTCVAWMHRVQGEVRPTEVCMPSEIELLEHLYERFNARDMEAVLMALDEDVLWANGMEGGHVHGRDGVRSYWTRQWAIIDPHVEPVEFSVADTGETVVEVHQTVHNLNRELLLDQMVGHIFRIENGLVKRFDIRGAQATEQQK
jgi:limonene-1,2-epoxide hydrolase